MVQDFLTIVFIHQLVLNNVCMSSGTRKILYRTRSVNIIIFDLFRVNYKYGMPHLSSERLKILICFSVEVL